MNFVTKGGRKSAHDCTMIVYCKDLHNSSICNKRQKTKDLNQTNIHHAQPNLSIFLRTAEVTFTDLNGKNSKGTVWYRFSKNL